MEINIHNSIINSPKAKQPRGPSWWWIHGLAYWADNQQKWKNWYLLSHGWTVKTRVKWAELIPKEHTAWFHLYKIPRTGLSRETDIRLGFPGAEGRMGGHGWWLRAQGFFRGWWKCSKIDCSHRLHLPRLRDTELHMLSGSILWYVNYISIALKKKSSGIQIIFLML